jgi:hypothetical protein
MENVGKAHPTKIIAGNKVFLVTQNDFLKFEGFEVVLSDLWDQPFVNPAKVTTLEILQSKCQVLKHEYPQMLEMHTAEKNLFFEFLVKKYRADEALIFAYADFKNMEYYLEGIVDVYIHFPRVSEYAYDVLSLFLKSEEGRNFLKGYDSLSEDLNYFLEILKDDKNPFS